MDDVKLVEDYSGLGMMAMVCLLDAPDNPAVSELCEYLRLRQAAENYLKTHPTARKAIEGLRQVAPDKFAMSL